MGSLWDAGHLANPNDMAYIRFGRANAAHVKGIMMAKRTNPLQFIQQVRAEGAKIVWPTRREVMLTSAMVFVLSALAATFFSLVDLGIREALDIVLNMFEDNSSAL